MRLAVMQPYLFPYIGYWQLMRAVDRFIVLDDVHYINRGWINRNQVLVNGAATYITAPLSGASQNKSICDIRLDSQRDWRQKLSRTVKYAYARAPCFEQVFPLVDAMIRVDSNQLSDYLTRQLTGMARFIGVSTEVFLASARCPSRGPRGQERIIDICRHEQAATYINLPGGRALYDAQAFKAAGIELAFLDVRAKAYRQVSPGFIPNLSIIDTLRSVGREGVADHLDSFLLDDGTAQESS
jgi:hypothetical protein